MLLGKSAEYKGIRCFWSDFLPFEQPRANLSIYDFISFLSLKCRDKNWLSTSPHGHTGNVKRQDRANKKKSKNTKWYYYYDCHYEVYLYSYFIKVYSIWRGECWNSDNDF